MSAASVQQVVYARFSNGVFLPLQPVDLPENAEVKLTAEMIPVADEQGVQPGSPEALRRYIEHCKASKLKLGGWNGREELYDDRI